MSNTIKFYQELMMKVFIDKNNGSLSFEHALIANNTSIVTKVRITSQLFLLQMFAPQKTQIFTKSVQLLLITIPKKKKRTRTHSLKNSSRKIPLNRRKMENLMTKISFQCSLTLTSS